MSNENYFELLEKNKKVFIITKNECPLCVQLKQLFDTIDIDYTLYNYIENEYEKNNNFPFKNEMKESTKGKMFPFCYINGIYVGGYREVHSNLMTGKLQEQLNEIGLEYEEDF